MSGQTSLAGHELIAGPYRVELVRSAADLKATDWNDVVHRAAGTIFHTWEWLTAFEEAPPGEFEAAHLLAYEGERLVGICPAYLVRQCPRLDYALALGQAEDLRERGPLLLAHSLAGLHGGPLALPGHQAAAQALVAGLEQAARSLGAWAWGVANVPADGFAGRLLGAGYAGAHVATAYRLDTANAAPAGYWAAMPSRRRSKLYREQRLGGRGLTIAETDLDTDILVRLTHELLREYNTPTDVLPEPFLRAVSRHLRPYARATVATGEDGEIVATFAGWEFAGEWSMWIAGLRTGRYPAFEPYHAMLAHTIDAALTTDTRVLNLGRGNAAVKARYGAVGTPLYLALKSDDRRDTALLHAWCRRLEARSHASPHGLGASSRCC
ncbi:GNAT family N-acetyltransferase [Herbidospora mongoliensis]|uniref:GNAT family N-acetyltransferase n=1 Tax=Herbidospora mongoliensis TaxID=688067 RepID=UPI00083407EE|nr:GNAT family N-acetyltransferase [Herbidospora mongoliensis]